MKMTIHNLAQGSPEWLAHRANTFNASDAPAMLGCGLYSGRAELLQRMHTGLSQEVDAATQRRYDGGHRSEALARPLAAEIIGEDLYPVVGSIAVDGLQRRLGASFDGLTIARDRNWEHKALNDDLRAVFDDIETIAPEHRDEQGGRLLHKHYRVQMEQQLLVGNCERVLFMASKWNGDELVEERHCWYVTDPALRAEIIAGWIQFEQDLAAYVPPERAAIVVATQVQALPSVLVQVSGSIIVTDNFADFKTALTDFLEHRLIREPKTDQDFADLEVQIKAMKGAEAALDAAEGQMLAQIMAVDQAKKTKDMLAKLVRENRLMAEKLLAGEKERRKLEIVNGATIALRKHIDQLNTRFERPYLAHAMVPADFGGAVRGLKSLASMEDKVGTELARCKIEAHEIADRIHANREDLKPGLGAIPGDDWISLFPDFAQVCTKSTEDFRNLRIARVEAERQRLEAQRARIRAEEQEKAEKEAREKVAAEQAEAKRLADEQAARTQITSERGLQQVLKAEAATPEATDRSTPATASPGVGPMGAGQPADAGPAGNVVPLTRPAAPPADTGARVKLGDINAAIAPLSISADGLLLLGFGPVATDKSAKLYSLASLPDIYAAMVSHIEAVQAKQAA